MLDEGLRRRLAGMAHGDEAALDAAARERVVATVGERGPALVRGARRQRWAIGAAVVAAAAAVVAAFGLRTATPPPDRAAAVPAQASTESAPAATSPVERACESRPDPSAAEVGFVRGATNQELDLGAVAYAAASRGSDVYLQEATRCRTVLSLRSGRVTVHAKDLGGGELVVMSGGAQVRVIGTLFSVARERGELSVEVAEGRVAVHRADHTDIVVDAGRVVAVPDSGELVEERALDSEAEAALLEAIVPVLPESKAGTAHRATPTDESLEALLSRADQLRSAGDIEGARRLYRRVGAGPGPAAEAAWLALARMELAEGNASAAREATAERAARFSGGSLGPEALWIQVRTLRQAGKDGEAKVAARQLVAQWPESPQAGAARRWLSSNR